MIDLCVGHDLLFYVIQYLKKKKNNTLHGSYWQKVAK